MVTVVQGKRKFSNILGESLGNAIESGSEGYKNAHDERALQKSIGDLPANATPRQILDALTNTKTYGRESKQAALKNYIGAAEFEETQRKAKAHEDIENKKIDAQTNAAKVKKDLADAKDRDELKKDQQDSRALIEFSDLPDEQKKTLYDKVDKGEVRSKAVEKILKPNKEAIKATEEKKSKDVTQKAFNGLAALIPKVGLSGIVTSKLGGDTAQSYAEFTSLTGALEAQLVEQVNRGALSNTRFKYITETLLPKPDDTQAVIKGKLTGLATILELDPAALGVEEAEQSQLDSKGRPPLSSFTRKE